MASKTTPENTLGQLLICLRMSKLHYVVKETPYSAFVTIRKKFVKSSNKDVFESENVVKGSTNEQAEFAELERENFHQKQKLKELGTECAMLQFEKEELGIKLEAVEKQNVALEDQIEVEMGKNRELFKENEKLRNANKDISEKSMKTENKSLESARKLENLKKSLKELDDKVLVMEHILKNRGLEIYSLRNELDTFQAANVIDCENCDDKKETVSLDEIMTESELCKETTSVRHVTCDQCEFIVDNEECLRLHMKETHEVKCETCDEIFAGLKKLRSHMCRVQIKDPEYFDIYMKNWYRRGDCIPVFSKRLKKELIILHSENCWEGENFCSDIPENVDTTVKSVLDENEIIHTAAMRKNGAVRKDGSICWLELLGLLQTHLPNYSTILC